MLHLKDLLDHRRIPRDFETVSSLKWYNTLY